MKCQRCDYRTEEAADAQAHARDAGHPLCGICAHSLRHTEPAHCDRCTQAVRDHLTGIVESFALLEVPLRTLPRRRPYDTLPTRSSDTSLLTPLVLRGPGNPSMGQPSRTGDTTHHADEHADDPPAVAATLGGWEDDWRHSRGEPANPNPATVVGAAGYLHRRLQWAADHHPAFAELAAELATLHRRLTAAVGTLGLPEVGVPCFDCGTLLRRDWTAHGLAEDWTCPSCRRDYTEPEYWLAVRAAYEAEAARRCG